MNVEQEPNNILINAFKYKPLKETMDYAYILSLSEYRSDIVMKATNDYDENLEWKYIPGHKVWGIPNYNAKGEINYEISIYGGKDSACPNELVKTFKSHIIF